MSYARRQPVGYLGDWDQRVPESEGAAPETYRILIGAVRNLPSGSAALVPERIGLFLRNAGVFEYWDARWISGGRVQVQYRARRGTDAYRSGVERRRVVEGALGAAAQSIGPNVRFDVGAPQSMTQTVRTLAPWLLGGAALLAMGSMAFVAGTSVEGTRRERVRANRRRRRRRS